MKSAHPWITPHEVARPKNKQRKWHRPISERVSQSVLNLGDWSVMLAQIRHVREDLLMHQPGKGPLENRPAVGKEGGKGREITPKIMYVEHEVGVDSEQQQ